MSTPVSAHERPRRKISAFQPAPGSLELAALVELLTVVPLAANPNLCKVVSIKMDLEEILHGAGEVFEIVYAGA